MADDAPSRPDPDAVDLVRRRLLLAGGRYVAPAVLASLVLGQAAYAQGCPPYVNRCSPFRSCAPGSCAPLRNPCRPAGG